MAMILVVDERVRTASTRSAAASMTCSQLSRTINKWRPASASATLAVTVIAACMVIPQRGRHGIGYGGRVANGGQFDEPDSVRELRHEFGGDLDGEAGFTDSTHAGERDESIARVPVR